MSTSLTTRPRSVCWTRNPIHWIFNHALPAPNSRLVIDLQTAIGFVVTEVQYPLKNGYSSTIPYLEHLMDPLLKWVRPSLLTPGPSDQPEEMTTNILGYKLRYAEVVAGASPIFTLDATITTAIKGELGDMNFLGAAVVNDGGGGLVLPTNGQFLTHVPPLRLQRPNEWGWLLYFVPDDYGRRVKYTVVFLDGSTTNKIASFPSSGGSWANRNWYLPTGVAQCNLDPTAKGVKAVGVSVEKLSGGSYVYEASYDITIDNRVYYNPFALYYRNSLGGWDNLTLRGERSHGLNIDRNEFATDINHSQNGTAQWFAASARPTFSGHTGYMTKEHIAVLFELLISTECAILMGGVWLPVKLTTTQINYHSTKDNLHSVLIDLETSGSFSAFPKQLAQLI